MNSRAESHLILHDIMEVFRGSTLGKKLCGLYTSAKAGNHNVFRLSLVLVLFK